MRRDTYIRTFVTAHSINGGSQEIGPRLTISSLVEKGSGALTKFLVTGANGFIGSHLTEHLIRQEIEVRALVEYNSYGSTGWLGQSDLRTSENLEIVSGDVRDSGFVRTAVEGADYILHLAALIGIPYSYSAPRSYVETNVLGTLNILEAALETEISRVVIASTSEVYGSAQYVPIDESHPRQAQSPYSATKIAADALAKSFSHTYGLPVTIVRPFNTYGPRQSARAVIPSIASQLLARRTRLRLGNIDTYRDLNYVSDIVKGFELASYANIDLGTEVNLASQHEISIKELALTMAGILGFDRGQIQFIEEQERVRPVASEVDRLLGDGTRAQSVFGWQPNVPLAQGLELTLEWISEELRQPSGLWISDNRYLT